MVSDIRLITIEEAGAAGAAQRSVCRRRLDEGLEKLRYPDVPKGDPPASGAKPYPVQIVLNPKAWGNFRKNAPIGFEIPPGKAEMHLALRREAEAAYSLGGWSMVDQLAVGVFGLDRFGSVSEFPPQKLERGAVGEELVQVLRANVSEDRKELLSTFDQVRRELVRRVNVCLALLESFAVCRAVSHELPACEAATLEEARRYLSLAATDDTSVRRALAEKYAASTQELSGPEGRSLVGALRTLAVSLRALRVAKDRFEASLPERKVAKGALWLALLGPAALPVVAAQAASAVKSLTAGDPERKAAGQQLARASAEFQGRFAEIALRYPIAFKIADAADQDEFVLRRRTVLALQDSLQAAAELAKRLEADPETIWRFPGLIDRSLREGFSAYGGFASRVAADTLSRENAMPLFARLNAGIQLLSTTLMFVPAPPVKVATAIASVIGDAAELIESYFRTREQKLGFRAAIDPALALGPDTSYGSTVIQAAFVALGLLPIPGAVREWAEESAEAARAVALSRAAAGVP